jgi:hypothetical protein
LEAIKELRNGEDGESQGRPARGDGRVETVKIKPKQPGNHLPATWISIPVRDLLLVG